MALVALGTNTFAGDRSETVVTLPITDSTTITDGEFVELSSGKLITSITTLSSSLVGVANTTKTMGVLATAGQQEYVGIITEGLVKVRGLVEGSGGTYTSALAVGTKVSFHYDATTGYGQFVVNSDAGAVGTVVEGSVASSGGTDDNWDYVIIQLDFEVAGGGANALIPSTITGAKTFSSAHTTSVAGSTFGAFGDGLGMPLTTALNDGIQIYPELASTGDVIDAGTVVYGIRNRFLVNKAQTNNVSLYATQGQLRVKANLAAGVHAGLYGYFEQSGTVTLSSSGSFNAACNLAIESDSSLTVDSGVNLAGCVITNVIDGSATVNGNLYGLMIRAGSGKKSYKAGLVLDSPVTSASILIDGSSAALLPSGEQAIYVNCPSETVATNGAWITLKSTVTSGDLTGARIKVHTLRETSGGPNVRGVYAQAIADTASTYAALLQGGLFVASYEGGSVTATNIYGVTGFISQGSGLTTSGNVAAVQAHLQTRGDESIGVHCGVLVHNEAVGGNGLTLDAGVYITESSLGGGEKGYVTLIDGSTATLDVHDTNQVDLIKFKDSGGTARKVVFDVDNNTVLEVQTA